MSSTVFVIVFMLHFNISIESFYVEVNFLILLLIVYFKIAVVVYVCRQK